jgi:hypothetical protein
LPLIAQPSLRWYAERVEINKAGSFGIIPNVGQMRFIYGGSGPNP